MAELDRDFVGRYAAGPSPSTIQQAVSLQTNIRAILGESEYVTFLQGSYKNDTALADLNDVDIVVVNRQVKASVFGWDHDWRKLFSAIERRLDGDIRYAGKWTRKDKCIQLSMGITIDLVPAIHEGSPTSDPIVIHSFRKGVEKRNWPRGHCENGAAKNQALGGAYKRLVRLYKKWARCCFSDRRTAPSYFLECLLYSLPNAIYSGDLPVDFVRAANVILEKYTGTWRHFFGNLPRIAGGGNILEEWEEEAFDEFLGRLRAAGEEAKEALAHAFEPAARAAWRRAFNGY